MIKKIFLIIILGLSFCPISFARELDSISSERDEEIDQTYFETRQKEVQSVAPQSSAPVNEKPQLNVRARYNNGTMTEWSLFSGPRLACRIKYKNRKPSSVEVFDKNGNPKSDEYRAFYPNGAPKLVETYRRGIQLTRNGFYENGQVRYKTKKRRDGSVASFREYDLIGKPKHGQYQEVYPNGQVKGIGSFRKGIPDGNFVSFCEDGKVVAEKQFKRGRLIHQSWEKSAQCEDTFSYLEDGVKPVLTIINKT